VKEKVARKRTFVDALDLMGEGNRMTDGVVDAGDSQHYRGDAPPFCVNSLFGFHF
jgi:hypothetical protein